MVFSSLPLFLDPPNLNQQQQQAQQQQIHQLGGSSSGGGEVISHLPLPAGLVLAAGSIRPPGSMSDRARLAKIPQPEAGLKCPRCDSNNTKFCYFNNYSLSQPRHFCKTCRRYWTHGGSLRNIPVGGGCRRNKRTKPSSAATNSTKSCTAAAAIPFVASSMAAATAASLHQLPFVSSLHPLPDFGGFGASVEPPANTLDYQLATAAENLRLKQLPQLPFLGGGRLDHVLPPPLDPVPAVYSFEGDSGGMFFAGSFAGPSTVKMDDKNSNQQIFTNLGRMQYLSISRNDQLFSGSGGRGGGGSASSGSAGGGGWAVDLSRFNNSSPSNIM